MSRYLSSAGSVPVRALALAVGALLTGLHAGAGLLRALPGDVAPGPTPRLFSLRSTPRTTEEQAILQRLHAESEALRRELAEHPRVVDPDAKDRELLRAAVAEPPAGLSERERQGFLVRRHIGVLEDVRVWAAEPTAYSASPYVLLGRLEACGYRLPFSLESEPRMYCLSSDYLEPLKRLSVEGNIAAAVVLARWYQGKGWWLRSAPERSGHHPVVLIHTLPARIDADARTGTYARRARTWAERRLKELRRELARLEGGR